MSKPESRMFNIPTKELSFDSQLPLRNNANQIQMMQAAGTQPRPANLSPNVIAASTQLNLPNHVTEVRAVVTRASDITSKVVVTYARDPGDYRFVDTRVFVSGYKGNPSPTQVASGQSPISFSLENTGEPIAVTVQASGNLGQAPITTAPATTIQLAKTPLATTPTPAGNGTSSGSSAPTFGLSSPGWITSGEGSNYSFSGSAGLWGPALANVPRFWMVQIMRQVTIRTMTFQLATTSATGVGGYAIYNSTGSTKLLSFENISFVAPTGPRVITNAGGSVTLAPGIYIHACAFSLAGTFGPTQASFTTQGTFDPNNSYNINGTKRAGKASALMVSGVMPSSLGTFSLDPDTSIQLPHCTFEP